MSKINLFEHYTLIQMIKERRKLKNNNFSLVRRTVSIEIVENKSLTRISNGYHFEENFR